MVRFIVLYTGCGESIYVNPNHIVSISLHEKYGCTLVETLNSTHYVQNTLDEISKILEVYNDSTN